MHINLKVCVIGERDILFLFKAFSFKTIPVNDKAYFNEKLKEEIISKTHRIIIITETYLVQMDDESRNLIHEYKPILVSIPTNSGSKEVALNDLSSLIRKAIGIDLLSVGGEKTNE